MTTIDLRPLRAELYRAREEHGRRSSVTLAAFEALWRASIQSGQSLSALRKYTADETERFFANTLPGTDGHVYWDGPAHGFVRNDKKIRVPRRWWWTHIYGVELGQYEDLVPTCGELNCINPEHCEKGRGLRRVQFSREQMLNALKVEALRLGRAPTTYDWAAADRTPTLRIYKLRFGSWRAAIEEAGLDYSAVVVNGRQSAEKCVEALHFVHGITGKRPSERTFYAMRAQVRAAGLPSRTTVKKHLGGWSDALKKAGF